VDYHSAHRAVIEEQKSSPWELNLGWTVNLEKGPYNGRRALTNEKARGLAWHFVGLEVDWNSLERRYQAHHLPPQLPTIAWRVSTPVYQNGEQIGYASSGCWSPLLKRYLALAHLRAPHFEPGNQVQMELTVEHQRKEADATVRALPFFDPERKRA
jgi:aminomethyltransferase